MESPAPSAALAPLAAPDTQNTPHTPPPPNAAALAQPAAQTAPPPAASDCASPLPQSRSSAPVGSGRRPTKDIDLLKLPIPLLPQRLLRLRLRLGQPSHSLLKLAEIPLILTPVIGCHFDCSTANVIRLWALQYRNEALRLAMTTLAQGSQKISANPLESKVAETERRVPRGHT